MDMFLKNYYKFPLIICISFLIGLIFEKIILVKLRKVANRTGWKGDDIITEALRGHIFLWVVMGGFYIAIYSTKIDIGIINVATKGLLIVLLISFISVITKIASRIVDIYISTGELKLPSVSIFANLIKIIAFIIGILVMLQTLGISITPIISALGIGGLAVALAFQDTFSNLF